MVVTTQVIGEVFEILITDQGVGIPDELGIKLLTSKGAVTREGTGGEKGTGFGLSLAKYYIEQYHGHLRYISKNTGETGTTFIISLKTA